MACRGFCRFGERVNNALRDFNTGILAKIDGKLDGLCFCILRLVFEYVRGGTWEKYSARRKSHKLP